ncbi:MAG: aspartate aminotransferase family protein [Acidiferrobacteraceae bacterium]|nr:aspartate aminotransferase family protein [Acidiferrobacteraceae bacterium]|tara:strand:+ start:2908 stop:4113 length:1206 start_codon:yes stop_codon:yes gene_type:complete
MSNKDTSFSYTDELQEAVECLRAAPEKLIELPSKYPHRGLGESAALRLLAPHILGDAAKLDSERALAHMDPPTPWITWATTLWNARLNQNLLHEATAPFAMKAEERVLEWLLPFFGMSGGHMCSGSTLANLTALWAARDSRQVRRIVASEAAHLSIAKAARMLSLPLEQIPTTRYGNIDISQIGSLSDACLVLTAGTTSTGEIDAFDLIGQAQWTHVDAAWGGPLRLTTSHAAKLSGIEKADSVAVSAHKLLFQPKEAALVMFANPSLANEAISFGGGYLASPNIGIQGSRGAAGVNLLATLIAFGQYGLAQRIDRVMEISQKLADGLEAESSIELLAPPKTGVTVFRIPNLDMQKFHKTLPVGMLSLCVIENEYWLRSVAANPLADEQSILKAIRQANRD